MGDGCAANCPTCNAEIPLDCRQEHEHLACLKCSSTWCKVLIDCDCGCNGQATGVRDLSEGCGYEELMSGAESFQC